MKLRVLNWTVVAVLTFFNLESVSTAVSYTAVALPRLSGSVQPVCPYDINNSGQVVGYAYTANMKQHAVLWTNGAITDLGTLGGEESVACGINDSGQIVGYATTTSGARHAFIYSNGRMTDLGTLSAGDSSAALGINAYGQIVGTASTFGGDSHAVRFDAGTVIDLGTLGGYQSASRAINSSGQIAGTSVCAGTAIYSHAFLYHGGAMTDLGTLGGPQSGASDINDRGQVVGGTCLAGSAPDVTHAFLYDEGMMKDLGTLGGTTSSASGINNIGQVVGWAKGVDGRTTACIWNNGTIANLNDLVVREIPQQLGGPPGSTVPFLRYADAINDFGCIVASTSGGVFLLTPIPEPSTLALLSIAAIGLLAYASRRRKLTPKAFSPLILAVVIGMTSQCNGEAIQWPAAVGGNNHWYDLVMPSSYLGSYSWTDAKVAAEAQGGYLVTVTSAGENDFLGKHFKSFLNENEVPGTGPQDSTYAWIGLYAPTPTSGFRWVTGEPYNYVNWASSEPNFFGDPLWQYVHYWTRQRPGDTAWTWNNEQNAGFAVDKLHNRYGYLVEYNTQPVPEPSMLGRASANFGLTGQLPTLCSLNCMDRKNLLCRWPATVGAITQITTSDNFNWEGFCSTQFPATHTEFALTLPCSG